MNQDELLQMITQQQEQSNRVMEQKMQQLMQSFAAGMEKYVAEKTTPAPIQRSAGMDVDQRELTDDPDEGEWTVDSAWEDVLPTPSRAAKGAGGPLATRMSFPPPLDIVRNFMKDVIPYTGVPRTPAPRKDRQDRTLYGLQQKLETILHLMVETADNLGTAPAPLLACAAIARSAWEDANEARRRNLARGQSYKLEPRQDATNIRLLSAAEEKAIRPSNFNRDKGGFKGRKQFPPQTNYQIAPYQRWTPSPDYQPQNHPWKGSGRGQPTSSKGSSGRGEKK